MVKLKIDRAEYNLTSAKFLVPGIQLQLRIAEVHFKGDAKLT